MDQQTKIRVHIKSALNKHENGSWESSVSACLYNNSHLNREMVFHFSILFWNEQFSDWLDQDKHSILLLLHHEHEPIPQRNQRWSVSLSLFPWMWIDMDKHQTEFHFLKPPLDSSHLHLDQKHIGKEHSVIKCGTVGIWLIGIWFQHWPYFINYESMLLEQITLFMWGQWLLFYFLCSFWN